MKHEISLPRIFCFIILMTLSLTGLGWAIGSYLGHNMPGYYRVMFPDAAREPGFDAVQVGVGLGLTQGVIAGVVISMLVTVGMFIRSILSAKNEVLVLPRDRTES